jgi:Mce-associated membrane protein
VNPTLYDILGVSPDASREEIRKAWREAADRFEPGEGGSTKQFRLFNEAAEVLLDPKRREEYDAQLPDREAPEPDETSDEAPGDESGDEPGDAEASHGDAATVPGSPVPGAAAATASATAAAGDRDSSAQAETDEVAASGQDQAPGAAKGPGLPWPVFAAIAVVTAVVVGFAAYFLVQAQRAEAYQEALDRAPAAAENAAGAVLSYDYKSLEADRDAAAKFLTDDYRSEYVDTFDKLVTENATDTKATVKAQVLASSAMAVGEGRDPHRVSVLLFVNQSTTSAATTGQPSVALNRVRFDRVEQDGTWLVGGITSY